MKSQLKALISETISNLESDLRYAKSQITYHYGQCDKTDKCINSKLHFYRLNDYKLVKRKLESKLNRLRALQVEVKKLSSYTTTKSKFDYVNGKPRLVATITTKEV